MNKADFINRFAESNDIESNAQATRLVNHFLETIKDGLIEDGNIAFIGFGTFSVADVPQRNHKVPGTDKVVTKDAHKKVKFKAGKGLSQEIN